VGPTVATKYTAGLYISFHMPYSVSVHGSGSLVMMILTVKARVKTHDHHRSKHHYLGTVVQLHLF